MQHRRTLPTFLLASQFVLACSNETGENAGASDDSIAQSRDEEASDEIPDSDSEDTSTPDGSVDLGPEDELVHPADLVPLFSSSTEQLSPVLEETETALITRFGDRGRDRHAREDAFAAYDHYLSHYWEFRTISAEIIDTVGRDPEGGSITFNVTTEYKLSDNEAELRFFYYGQNTVAEYHNNGVMTALDDTHYTRSVSTHGATNQPLQVGDFMEFELSQFLDVSVEELGGRANYYGTTYLYVVGEGLVPWQADTVLGDDLCPCNEEDSRPIDEEGWLGGRMTLPYQYSNEPRDHFMQMATNLAGENAQPFVLGRRLVHTEFLAGTHSENSYEGGDIIDNPVFTEQSGKLGPHYVHESCDACHTQNSRATPPALGAFLDQYVFLVGDDENAPLADVGRVLQPGDDLGASEGSVSLVSWIEEDGLRRPEFAFGGVQPTRYSARIAPQLVGMGLLEAIAEDAILRGADPGDEDGDGISGRARLVDDPVTGEPRLGRFGWKAAQASVRTQVAGALNTDMGVMTSVFPTPDCGTEQELCETGGAELNDADLENLVRYISLLGIRARRDLDSAEALEGEELFDSLGCAECHTPTFQTSALARFAETRDQKIHPYTDLLLHDMGDGLADSLGESDASGAEWRTPPLWNIGLTDDVSQGEAYLHDGRARSLKEAILWHGGEGEAAKDAFSALSSTQQAQLLAFLRSL